jgi:hypothetical protein
MPDEQVTEEQQTDEIDTAAPEAEPESPQEMTEDVAEDAEKFPRSYVEKLRQESGKYRQRAQRADGWAQRLHVELVRATGRMADPSDLPFDEAHLDDPAALAAAVDDLLTRKPHLASRRPTGEIGQGASPPAASSVDLAALLRQRAR